MRDRAASVYLVACSDQKITFGEGLHRRRKRLCSPAFGEGAWHDTPIPCGELALLDRASFSVIVLRANAPELDLLDQHPARNG
jgi:hypothetical protein